MLTKSLGQMTVQVIAICGYKRSGKDTIANYLCDKYGFQHCKISKGLKEMCKCLFGFNDSQMESDLKEVVDKKWGITPRKAMQYVGTDMMQYQIQNILPDIGRNFWIYKCIKHIEDNHKDDLRIVISDMRFIHEYDLLKKTYGDNFKVIKVLRNCSSMAATRKQHSELQ